MGWAKGDPVRPSMFGALARARWLLIGLFMRGPTLAMLLLATASQGYEVRRSASGEVVRWAGQVDFVIDKKAGAQVNDSKVFAAVQAAAEAVSKSTPGLVVTVRAGDAEGVGYDFEDRSKNRNEVAFPSSWSFDNEALAVTVVTVDTARNRIVDTDIAFNPRHKFKVIQGKPDDQHFDVQNTFTHELGHAVGLAHNGDATSVMYPKAIRGETSKRNLNADDVAGLRFLYPEDQPAEELAQDSAVGCSATGRGGLGGLAVLGALLLLRRRRAALVALAMVPAVVQASSPQRADAPAKAASVVATGEVVSRRTLPPAKGERVLATSLELKVRSCVKGACPERLWVVVPGGRWGGLEQAVEGTAVPESGDVLGVTLAPTEAQAQVYRLNEWRDFSAFARGLDAAGLPVKLEVPRLKVNGSAP